MRWGRPGLWHSGLMADFKQSNKLHNVPAEGISSFDPYGYFGVYEMDVVWMD